MKSKATIERIRKLILGNDSDGLIWKLGIYAFTIIVGFVFVYPLLDTISNRG